MPPKKKSNVKAPPKKKVPTKNAKPAKSAKQAKNEKLEKKEKKDDESESEEVSSELDLSLSEEEDESGEDSVDLDYQEDPKSDDESEDDGSGDDEDEDDVKDEDRLILVFDERERDRAERTVLTGDDRVMSDRLTLQELTFVICSRVAQIESNSVVFAEIQDIDHPRAIAIRELKNKACPLKVLRHSHGNVYEEWRINEMKIPWNSSGMTK